MNQRPSAQHFGRRHGGRLLKYPLDKTVTLADFTGLEVAVFIHGFTANASYLLEAMHQFEGGGYFPIAYEYPSDRGINQAAAVLCELFERYDGSTGTISSNKVTLICHSMGGLVARAFVALNGGGRFVKKIVTLGTPHDGTLKSARVLKWMLAWGEHISGLNPVAFSPSALSAKELLGNDDAPTLLERLSGVSVPEIEVVSMSGGLPALEFGTSWLKNAAANFYLQRNLRQPNDGLVEESSSDVSQESLRNLFKRCSHNNKYCEYGVTNHSNLVTNQLIAITALDCARGDAGGC